MEEKAINKEIWEKFIAEISKTTSKTAVELWFTPFRIEGIRGNDVYLVCDSDFRKQMAEEKYKDLIKTKLAEIVGFDVNPLFYSEENGHFDFSNAGTIEKKRKREEISFPERIFTDYNPAISPDEDVSIPINANNYTFETFIEGSSNQFAKAACVSVSENLGNLYNPLFIYGPSGIGKTHLLWSIINRLKEKKPEYKIIYVPGDDFTNQMIESIGLGPKSTAQFRNKYRAADIILLDDIQFIAGRNSTQEEFFHTFNALYAENKQIVMTSDRPPKDIKTLEERLRTRFEGGLVVDIQPPDYELRMAIMKSKASAMGVNLPNDVLELLATSLKSNVRQLEGAIKTISAQSFLTGNPITMELAKSCVADLYNTGEPVANTVDRIFQAVSRKTGIAVQDIKGSRRSQDIANARHLCVFLMKTLTDMSLPAIGRTIGRSHSTVINSLDNIENDRKTNPQLSAEIKDLCERIKGKE